MKKAKHTGKEVTIVGVVEEYEEEGRIGIVIATDDDDYVVELNKQGKRLSQEIDTDVEVTGYVTKNSDGTKRITVTKFDILDFDDDEDDIFYDDDEDDRYDEDDPYDDDDRRRWL
ncbi:MAG: hypothetical protein JRE92_01215 [Deltaproteobacteria bacterium]|jgi:phosphorylcholine metabolism protein LicD|nr:hypothetical protein [Deltaproteobacteria bacterium]MBW2449032.1 hypothetical protein [Deltaproteobacteria bacterium]